MPQIKIVSATEPIVIDGILSESDWFKGVPANDFWQYFPTDSVLAKYQTEIYFTYDDKNLYVATKCYARADQHVVPSLKRDFRAGNSDNITLLFDPFNDRTNAFIFGINPAGVLREGLISNGGMDNSDFTTAWDNVWNGAAKVYDDHWIAEFAIPFKTLRFDGDNPTWRFNSYRFDTQGNENSTWIRIPQNQNIYSLAFMGELKWDVPPKSQGANVALIPYATAGVQQDFTLENSKPDITRNIGGDAKLAVTSGLNLDLTFNPDFSQVEVDEQVTNLSRFEVFFPERRQFFIENADLFGNFGSERINPFFSRRIGIGFDTLTETNVQNTIYYGARLNGKLNENWRVGLLNMQTAKDDAKGIPATNYTVAAVRRKLFSRSNIGLIAVNKENFTDDPNLSPYNRVIGLDYILASSDNTWTGKVFAQQAITPSDLEHKLAHGVNLQFNKRSFGINWLHRYVGEGYEAEVGFTPRTDYFKVRPEFLLKFYPQNSIFNNIRLSFQPDIVWKPGFGKTDHEYELSLNTQFVNNSRFGIRVKQEYTYLFDDFDPTRVDSTATLAANTSYRYFSANANYNSDRRKPFNFQIRPAIGQFFNGWRASIRGSFGIRFEPYANISLNYSYNYIDLPNADAPTTLFLIGPRIDLTFSKSLFLTTFLQYNQQSDNFNVNARLQWRFRPVSDLYIVYTDNYFASDFTKKTRALVAKATYWLNL